MQKLLLLVIYIFINIEWCFEYEMMYCIWIGLVVTCYHAARENKVTIASLLTLFIRLEWGGHFSQRSNWLQT